MAAATPVAHVGDPKANAGEHLALIRQAGEQGVDLMVFPELSLSAYAIDDLHLQIALLDAVEEAIGQIAAETAELAPVLAFGAAEISDRLRPLRALASPGRVSIARRTIASTRARSWPSSAATASPSTANRPSPPLAFALSLPRPRAER